MDPELPGDLPRLLRADIFLGKPFDELKGLLGRL
jgi:hypothetical protein